MLCRKSNIYIVLIILYSQLSWSAEDKCQTLLRKQQQLLYSYSRLYHGIADYFSKPGDEGELADIFHCASKDDASITIRGSGFSFGDQSMPPLHNGKKSNVRYLISTENLNSIQVVKVDRHKLRLRVGAGVTWHQALDFAHRETGFDIVPFDAPTNQAISIVGSIASHTHSRTSDVMGKYAVDYVSRLSLVTPVSTIDCNYENEELNSEACRYVPGSYGRLGVISSLDIDFRILPKGQKIGSKIVLVKKNLRDFLDEYFRITIKNASEHYYDHGVLGILQWSDEGSCLGKILASSSMIPCKSGDFNNVCNGIGNMTISGIDTSMEFPGFDGSTLKNQLAYALAHRYTHLGLHEYGMDWFIPEGVSGVSHPYSWFFFQNSHSSARKMLQAGGFLSNILFLMGIDENLPTAHQTWFFPGDDKEGLYDFISSAWSMLNQQEYLQIKGMIELQDLIRIPSSRHPNSPAYHYGHGHIYTISLAVHSDEEAHLADRFFSEISEKGFLSGVVPILLKEVHMSDITRKESAHIYFEEMLKQAEMLDPECLIQSAFWNKLDNRCFGRQPD